MKLKSMKNLLLILSIAVLVGVLIGTSLVSGLKEPGESLLDNNGKVPQISLHPYLTLSKSRKTKGNLESGINVVLCLLNFGVFSRGYIFVKGAWIEFALNA